MTWVTGEGRGRREEERGGEGGEGGDLPRVWHWGLVWSGGAQCGHMRLSTARNSILTGTGATRGKQHLEKTFF